MYLKKLVINNFRNIKYFDLEFQSSRIFFFGNNAQGKTNIIESIYTLCLTKSFRTRDESELVMFGEDGFTIEGTFLDEIRISRRIVVLYQLTSGKKIHLDGKPLPQFSKLVGLFPVVILSSEDHTVTIGPPSQRRRFFNILLSQISSIYLEALKDYERILRQRNQVLNNIGMGDRKANDQLEVWNKQLVKTGSVIIKSREKIVKEINPILNEYYQKLTSKKNQLQIVYEPNVRKTEDEDIEKQFMSMLTAFMTKEIYQGKTLIGPHRDEFVFSINNKNLRKYGSRGEHKSVLVSLKTAEAHLLKKKTETEPILLLDDLYSELDRERAKRALDLFPAQSQTFITGTTADYDSMRAVIESDQDSTVYFINNGQIE